MSEAHDIKVVKKKKKTFSNTLSEGEPVMAHVMNINSRSFFDVHEQGSHSFFSNKCKDFSLSFPVISRTPCNACNVFSQEPA